MHISSEAQFEAPQVNQYECFVSEEYVSGVNNVVAEVQHKTSADLAF